MLGRGTFDQTFVLDRDVTVMGSCPSDTRVISSFAAIDSGVVTVQSDAELMNLTIGGESIGVLVESGRLLARDLIVSGARQIGVRAIGGEVILENVVIRDTPSAPSEGLGFGHGIAARNGARVEVTRAVLENNREIAIALRGPVSTPHRFTDVAIVDTQLEDEFDTGRGSTSPSRRTRSSSASSSTGTTT